MKMNVLTACIRLAVVIGVAIMPAVFGATLEEEEWYKKAHTTPDADEAIGFHTKAILANPNFAFGYLGRGRAKIRKKDFDGAIEDFTRAVEIAPNFSEAYGWRGRAKRAKGDMSGARLDFTKFVEGKKRGGGYVLEYQNKKILADPENTELYLERAKYNTYNRLDYAAAVKDYDKYIELVGEPNSIIYSDRAYVKYRAGDIEGAMADYTLAITKSPDDQMAYTDRGRFKELLGDFKGAEMDFLEAKKIGEKMWMEEMAALTRILEKNPSDVDSLYKRSGVKMDLEDYAGAIEDLDKAIEIQPDSSLMYYERSKAKKQNGGIDGYEADLKKYEEMVQSK